MGGFRSSAFDGSALWLDALSRLAFCVIYASVKARHIVAATYTCQFLLAFVLPAFLMYVSLCDTITAIRSKL